MKHLEANGFAVKVNATEPAALERLKAQAGIVSKLGACHTAKIGSYVIEGHVPATDIKRLVVERPEFDRPCRSRHARGLARNGARRRI